MSGQPEPGSNDWITFDVTNVTYLEPGMQPNTVIEVNRPFDVEIDFQFDGSLALLLCSLGVDCDATANVESIGPGVDRRFGPVRVLTNASSTSYSAIISVPAGSLPPGEYKVIGAVRVEGHPGPPPSPIVGYCEGPVLQIYRP